MLLKWETLKRLTILMKSVCDGTITRWITQCNILYQVCALSWLNRRFFMYVFIIALKPLKNDRCSRNWEEILIVSRLDDVKHNVNLSRYWIVANLWLEKGLMMISNNKLIEKHSSTCAPFQFLFFFWRFPVLLCLMNGTRLWDGSQFVGRRRIIIYVQNV